jgi:hypothetical protein
MRKFLKAIWVIQEVSNKGRNPKLGRGFSTAKRLNPYNPLSYLTIIILFIVGHILFGVVGVWKQFDTQNPFKWN